MNNKKISARRLVLAAVLGPALGVVTVLGAPRTTASTRTTPATPNASAAVVTGAWVYKDALTVETLRLHVGKKGAVAGNGSSTVKSVKDPHQTGQFTIDVHEGRLHNNVLTLSLNIQRQFGNYLTIAEELRCTPTTRVLHCHMTAPLYPTVKNVPQDFYRR